MAENMTNVNSEKVVGERFGQGGRLRQVPLIEIMTWFAHQTT